MIPKRPLRFASLGLGLYLVIVWAVVSLFLRGFHPVAFGLGLSVCGVTVYLVYLLVAPLLAQQTATPKDEKAGTTTPPTRQSDKDLEEVKELLAIANRRLASSPKVSSERLRTTVDQLPLYLLIGLEGSGKTSTFVHSDLDPELLAGQVYQDHLIVPTPSCNTWLASGAIFLEVAGSFFTGDAARFGRLLKMLRPSGLSLLAQLWGKRRKSENLRGAVLCCDIAAFLGIPNATQQAAVARLLRERLSTIGEIFGADFPVWVVFTKSDQIKYFSEYFGRLTSEEQREVLGCSLSSGREAGGGGSSEESEGRRLAAPLNRLYYALANKRLKLLPREPDSIARLRGYEFPREVRRVRSNLVQFLVDTFRPDPLQPGPLLRGFYFVGTRMVSTEEMRDDGPKRPPTDNPTEVLPKEKADQVFGRKNMGQVVPQWAFTSDLFSKVILGDETAVLQAYGNRRLDWYRRVAFGTGIAALVVLGSFAGRSWAKSQSLLADLKETTNQLPALRTRDEAIGRLAFLEHLREGSENLSRYRESGPPWANLWLYPRQTLVVPARNFYFHRFHEYLLADVEKSLKAKLGEVPLKRADSLPYETVYLELKGYLGITDQACEADPAILTQTWRGDRNIDKGILTTAQRQFVYFVDERKKGEIPIHLTADEALVARGREYLVQFDPAEGIYRNLLDQATQSMKPAALVDYSRGYKSVLLGSGEVRAAFTKDAAKVVLDQIASAKWATDSCVFGKGGQGIVNDNQLKERLRERYIREYIEAWRKFLGGLTVARYAGAKDASAKLGVLTEADSSVVAALFMATEHTNFSSSNPLAGTGTVAVEPKKPGGAEGRKGPPTGVEDVTRSFQPAHTLFTTSATRSRFIDGQNQSYLDALRSLQQAMERLAPSSDNREARSEAGRALQGGLDAVKSVSYRFERSEAQVDRAVRQLLEAPLQAAHHLTDDQMDRARMDAALRQLCGKLDTLRKKYPFNPKSADEVSDVDLTQFFAFEGGALWTFHREFLETLVEKQGAQWVQRRGNNAASVRLSPQFLQYFNRLASISEALFPPNGSRPGMDYRIKVLKPENVTSLTVDAGDGDRPQGEHTFRWPAENFTVRVMPGAVPMAGYGGMWSVFSMVAGAKHLPNGVLELNCVRSGPRSLCLPASGTDGQPVVVHIHAVKPPNGVARAFDHDFLDLTGLTCPLRVTER